MCAVLLPPGVNPITVKYESYHLNLLPGKSVCEGNFYRVKKIRSTDCDLNIRIWSAAFVDSWQSSYLPQSLIGTSFYHLTLVASATFRVLCNCLWCAGKQQSGLTIAVFPTDIAVRQDDPWALNHGSRIYGSAETSTTSVSTSPCVHTNWCELS
jgi:hypothetical protein